MKKINFLWTLLLISVSIISCNTLADDLKVEPTDWSRGINKGSVYLMSYQTPNMYISDDSLHLAYSYNGLSWTAVNSGNTIHQCGIGSLHIRDPFVFRLNDGSFVLLAADFTNSGKRWDLGSRADVNGYWTHPTGKIYVAYSDDLAEWKNGHMMTITKSKGKDGARHVWTPKARYNETDKCYDIYWVGDTQDGENHVYRTQTYDFLTALSFDDYMIYNPGYSVKDVYVVEDGDFYMFTKDERNVFSTQYGGDIQIAKSPSWDIPKFKRILDGSYVNRINNKYSMIQVEYPCIYKTADKWIMFVNETNSFNGSEGNHTAPLATDIFEAEKLDESWANAAGVTLPNNAISASVLMITNEELDGLLNPANGYK